MHHCTGTFGKRCNCGAWHGNSGMSVDHGWQSNHTDADEDEELRCSNVLASIFLIALGCGVGLGLVVTAALFAVRWM
jgi:hypothetical protein